MKIYTVTTDDNCGTDVQVFIDEAKADARAMEYLRDKWSTTFHGRMPDDVEKALRIYQSRDPEDLIWYQVHEIEDAEIVRSAKAQLADLLEQVYQMKGMFDDDDGRVQQAIDDAEAWPELVLTRNF